MMIQVGLTMWTMNRYWGIIPVVIIRIVEWVLLYSKNMTLLQTLILCLEIGMIWSWKSKSDPALLASIVQETPVCGVSLVSPTPQFTPTQ